MYNSETPKAPLSELLSLSLTIQLSEMEFSNYQEHRIDATYDINGVLQTANFIMKHEEDEIYLRFSYGVDRDGIAHIESISYDNGLLERLVIPLRVLQWIESAEDRISRLVDVKEVEPFPKTVETFIES